MTDRLVAPSAVGKLEVLRDRLKVEQRRLNLHAADIDALPSSGLVNRIAHLEGAIVGTEEAIEQGRVQAEQMELPQQ